jgi:hypothetical protein
MADELSLGLAPLIVRLLLKVLRKAADSGAGVFLTEQRAREALSSPIGPVSFDGAVFSSKARPRRSPRTWGASRERTSMAWSSRSMHWPTRGTD